MDWIAAAQAGFLTVEAEQKTRDQALDFLKVWLTASEFIAYRPQLEWMIQSAKWDALLDSFSQILPFGTGGRRGGVGIGPNRMNLWTLGASVQGHCEYLKGRFPDEVKQLAVVLAYDVRQFEDKRKVYNRELPNPVLHLTSRDFAEYAASVYAANGIQSRILPRGATRYMATPELSYAIRMRKAHGGLNVSASHNPPDDNGGKFYDERGGQPVAPEDQMMSEFVEKVTTIRTKPWTDAVRDGQIQFLDDGPYRAYIELCRKQGVSTPPHSGELKVVYTSLHGVGRWTAQEAMKQRGFNPIPVSSQTEADGQFPNVTKSPNPEVPECFDRALEVASEHHADLILATDPDADRIGAMSSTAKQGGGKFQFITGNQIAVLLTHYKLAKLSRDRTLPPSPIVVRTEVTTSLVSRISRYFNAQVVENLMVGFKFIAEVLWKLESEGHYEDIVGTPEDFIIASEESHGVLTTAEIRDKDAAGAAVLFAEMALEQKRQGRTVPEYLDQLHRQFGYFRNDLKNLVMEGITGKEKMKKVMAALRANPPMQLGGLAVTEYEDLQNESGRLKKLQGDTDALSRNFLIFRLGENAKVVIRPSGTEPKAKVYIEVSSAPWKPGTPETEWLASCAKVDALAKALAEDFVQQALKSVS